MRVCLFRHLRMLRRTPGANQPTETNTSSHRSPFGPCLLRRPTPECRKNDPTRRSPGHDTPNHGQKFLRKQFKDPITGDDFEAVRPSTTPSVNVTPQPAGRGGAGERGVPGSPATGQRDIAPGSQRTPGGAAGAQRPPGGAGASAPGGPVGQVVGIAGVVSKSKDESLRLYNGRNHYNEWIFQPVQRTQAPGTGAPGSPTPAAVPC